MEPTFSRVLEKFRLYLFPTLHFQWEAILHCRKKIRHLGIICKTQQGFGFLTLANYKSLVGQTSTDKINNIICKWLIEKLKAKIFWWPTYCYIAEVLHILAQRRLYTRGCQVHVTQMLQWGDTLIGKLFSPLPPPCWHNFFVSLETVNLRIFFSAHNCKPVKKYLLKECR